MDADHLKTAVSSNLGGAACAVSMANRSRSGAASVGHWNVGTNAVRLVGHTYLKARGKGSCGRLRTKNDALGGHCYVVTSAL